MSLFEKFPPLEWKGKKLIWDTRQAEEGFAEILVFDENTSKEFQTLFIERTKRNKDSELFLVEQGVPEFLKIRAIEQWGEASQKLKILGVTGTNGKSTSVALLRHLLCEQGVSCAEVGTLGISLFKAHASQAYEILDTGFTTPECHQLHYLFHQLHLRSIEYVAIEVSSHAIELDRIKGVCFAGAIFTNLTQDHLDFHKTMEAYEAAKLKLFTQYIVSRKHSVSVVNSQNDVGKRYFSQLQKLSPAVFSFSHPQTYEILSSNAKGLRIQLLSGESITSPLVGNYNAENIVGALELVHQVMKVSRNDLALSLKHFSGVCGRLERVSPVESELSVFVDYAHTPDALEKALGALQSLKVAGAKLYCVFGCGGDRDASKRPVMGRIASQLSDFVVVTSDNPRSENPDTIIANIVEGIEAKYLGNVLKCVDRKKAIIKALEMLEPGDLLLIAGKGHEQYQIIGNTKTDFSDQKIVSEYFRVK